MKNSLKKLCSMLVIAVMLLPMLMINVQAASYIWPLDDDLDYITSYAGNRVHPLTGKKQNHSGIDIRAPKGSSVYATASGVAYIGCNWCSHNYGKSKSCGCGGGYGNYIYIIHKNGMVSYYAHLTSVLIDDGQYVSQGTRIGTSGSTGSSTGFHLHFEMRTSTSRDDREDPLDYVSLPGESDSGSSNVIPEENTSSGGNTSSTFNPNVVEYYTGFVSGNQNSSAGNVIDTYTPSIPNESTGSKTGSVVISMTSYPEALKKGKSCNLKGTVTADEDLTRVTGTILNSTGYAEQTIVVYPDDDSLNIKSSNINKKLSFGKLSDGTYTLRIEATAEDGSTDKWERAFTVGNAQSSQTQTGSSSSTQVSPSGVTIDVTKYPTEIKRGSSFSLRGTISSSDRISTIRGYILDENMDEVQSTSDSANSKSVNIKSKNVNKKLAFGKLAKGTYTLKIVAVDDNNNIGIWEKTFIVK